MIMHTYVVVYTICFMFFFDSSPSLLRHKDATALLRTPPSALERCCNLPGSGLETKKERKATPSTFGEAAESVGRPPPKQDGFHFSWKLPRRCNFFTPLRCLGMLDAGEAGEALRGIIQARRCLGSDEARARVCCAGCVPVLQYR
jgi:hypothetical protein